MIGSVSSRCSGASQTEGAFRLQPGILGIGVSRWQRAAAGVAETLVTVNARTTVLLEEAVGVLQPP